MDAKSEIRDRFAGQIAAAAIHKVGSLPPDQMERIAKVSYRMADALVRERKRRLKRKGR